MASAVGTSMISLVDSGICPSALIGPRHPAADSGDDLVGDGAQPLAPLLGGGLAVVARPEQHDLVPGLDRLVTEVDHELGHAHGPGDVPAAAAGPGPRASE